MMEAESGPAFPVVFFDGEQETSLGNVVVSPSSNFRGFQSILCEKIGLSPHQFSIYVTDRKRRSSKIPITGKNNLWAVAREDCIFLVVLKRSKHERRRKVYEMTETIQNRFDPPANVMLLRRDGSNIAINSDEFSGSGLSRIGYERRVIELQKEKEKYLMNMGLGFDVPNVGTGRGNGGVACEDCERAKEVGREAGFHWCVYDTVTFAFKSPAGPIARPVKGSN